MNGRLNACILAVAALCGSPVLARPATAGPPMQAGGGASTVAEPASTPESDPTRPKPRIRHPRPTGDAAFAAPPFPVEPRLEPLRGSGALLVHRTTITYWKRDGREIGPWVADLFSLPAADVGRGAVRINGGEIAIAEGSVADGDAGAAGILVDGEIKTLAGTRRPKALVVLLPIAGNASYAERFARDLVGPDLSVLELHPLPPGSDGGVLHSLQGTAKTLTEDTANVRRILRWAVERLEIDPDRIGLVGMSRGAIVAALTAQLDPRLSTVLVLGGADLPGLFRDSNRGIVKRLRDTEIARAGGDLEAAVAKAAAILGNVDPASRSGRLDPRRTLLVNARWDHVIPRRQALALRRAAGGATQYWLPTGHGNALLYLPRVRALARNHFRETLGVSGAGPSTSRALHFPSPNSFCPTPLDWSQPPPQ